MTECETLKMAEAFIRGQIAVVQSSIDAGTANANTMFGAIILLDVGYGGSLPPADPLTAAGVQARMDYLNGLNPKPMMVLFMYGSLKGILEQVEGLKDPTMVNLVAQLGENLAQQVTNNCG